jgi:hypothetical protein
MITVDIWEDGFVGSLTFFERLLWIGLITLADDQGRTENDPLVISRKVFLRDKNITEEQVAEALRKFEIAGKVVTYEAGGKNLLQIVNWWKHQAMQWPAASKYPAPNGWIDRIKEHLPGNKVRAINWDLPGGFQTDVPTDVPTYVPTDVPLQQGTRIEEVKGEVKGEVEGKVDDDDAPVLSDLSVAFVNSTGIPELTGGVKAWTEALDEMERAGVEPCDIEQAVKDMREKNYSIVRLRSIVNPAIASMSKRRAKPNGNGPPPGARPISEAQNPDGSLYV